MMKYLIPLAVPLAVALAMPAMPGTQGRIQPRPESTPAPPMEATPAPAAPAGPAVTPTPPADPLAEAPRISAADARKALEAGTAVLVDVRSQDSWQEEHAKGAVSIPVNEIYARMGELPKDKQIIAYCT
jgi:hypothetical protein